MMRFVDNHHIPRAAGNMREVLGGFGGVQRRKARKTARLLFELGTVVSIPTSPRKCLDLPATWTKPQPEGLSPSGHATFYA